MTETTETYSARNTVTELILGSIRPSALNPRQHFAAEPLKELAESLTQHGLIEPIVVRCIGVGDEQYVNAYYEIIAGERRWRAAQLAGFETILARVLFDVDDATALRLALIENLQREDLDPIEEAEGYRQLNKIVGLKQAAIAAAVNRSQPAVANAMRLLELPADVQERIRAGELSVSHGVALAKYKDFPELASAIAERAVSARLTSHQLEDKHLLETYAYSLPPAVARRFAGEPFEDCKACPFNAFRAGSHSYMNLCLNPTHYEQLQAARNAAHEALLVAKVAAAVEQAGGELPTTDALMREFGSANVRRLWSGAQLPAGCSETCVCRRQALDHNGSVELLCVDENRHRELMAAESAAKDAHKAERLATRAAELTAAVDALTMPTQRDLALLVAAALDRAQADAVAGAARHFSAEKGAVKALKAAIGYQQRDLLPATLMALPSERLLRLGVEALLLNGIQGAWSKYGSGQESWAGWYLDNDATEVAQQDADSDQLPPLILDDVPDDDALARAAADLAAWKAEPWTEDDDDSEVA